MQKETPRKRRARINREWKLALAEGRVVKLDEFTMKSFPTVVAAVASGYPIVSN